MSTLAGTTSTTFLNPKDIERKGSSVVLTIQPNVTVLMISTTVVWKMVLSRYIWLSNGSYRCSTGNSSIPWLRMAWLHNQQLHALTLDDCPGITDVSALGSVHTLGLKNCPQIIDVSALGSVHALYFHIDVVQSTIACVVFFSRSTRANFHACKFTTSKPLSRLKSVNYPALC